MNRVPDGWDIQPLKEVADVAVSPVDKKSHSDEIEVVSCNYMDVYSNTTITADLQFLPITATEAEIKKFLLARGDVLITKDSEDPRDIAVPAYVKDELDMVLCGYHLARIRPDFKELDGVYLNYQLQHPELKDYFYRVSNGSTRFGLPIGDIENTPTPLPPLPEQKRIAAILSSVDGAIAATQAVIDQTRKVKEGLLQDLLTKGIGHNKFKQTEIGEIPEGWEVKRLKDVASTKGLQTGPFGSQLHAHEYTQEGVAVVMPKDIIGGIINYKTAAKVPSEVVQRLTKHVVKTGDILFGRRGDIGRCGLVTESCAGAICGTGCLRARLASGMSPHFFIQQIQSERCKNWLILNAVGQTMLNLNVQIIGDLPVAVPPASEQKEIAEILLAVQRTIDEGLPKLEQLHQTKRGLMQDLLSGSVRV